MGLGKILIGMILLFFGFVLLLILLGVFSMDNIPLIENVSNSVMFIIAAVMILVGFFLMRSRSTRR